jgi:hypothetical protein
VSRDSILLGTVVILRLVTLGCATSILQYFILSCNMYTYKNLKIYNKIYDWQQKYIHPIVNTAIRYMLHHCVYQSIIISSSSSSSSSSTILHHHGYHYSNSSLSIGDRSRSVHCDRFMYVTYFFNEDDDIVIVVVVVVVVSWIPFYASRQVNLLHRITSHHTHWSPSLTHTHSSLLFSSLFLRRRQTLSDQK